MVGFIFLMSQCHWFDPLRIQVKVYYHGVGQIEDVVVIAHADKSPLGYFQPGEEKNTRLYPTNPVSDNNVDLRYTLTSSQRTRFWSTRNQIPGKGYNVEIDILGNDELIYRACYRPCDISSLPWSGRLKTTD